MQIGINFCQVKQNNSENKKGETWFKLLFLFCFSLNWDSVSKEENILTSEVEKLHFKKAAVNQSS